PKRIDPARPALVRLMQSGEQPVEFAFLLERRIYQHDAALFLGRQMRTERQPAVEFDDPRLEIAFELTAQRLDIFRVQLDGGEPVLLAQKMTCDDRRAGVELEFIFRVN